MNKSLAIKNKLFLFFSLIFILFVLIYLFYFLINGPRGIIAYYKMENTNSEFISELKDLNIKNNLFINKTKRLQPNTIDLDYLDEQLRLKTGYLLENEIIISLQNK